MPTKSFLASPTATIETLNRFSLKTKKSLGQHFLIDDNIIARILDLAEVKSGETVLEIGPGIGTLSVALLGEGSNVVAIEHDHDLVEVLSETTTFAIRNFRKRGSVQGKSLKDFALRNNSVVNDEAIPKFVLLEMDALDITQEILEHTCAAQGIALPVKLVANLPYNIAATLVLKILQSIPSIKSICVMVQSEVAARMAAKPSTPDYGAYSIKVALLAKATGSFNVSRSNFLPPPHVDSTVIRLDRVDLGFGLEETGVDSSSVGTKEVGSSDTITTSNDSQNRAAIIAAASLAAEAAFAQRRKTIKNSMFSYLSSRGIARDDIQKALEKVQINPSLRGENLSVESYIELGKALLEIIGAPLERLLLK